MFAPPWPLSGGILLQGTQPGLLCRIYWAMAKWTAEDKAMLKLVIFSVLCTGSERVEWLTRVHFVFLFFLIVSLGVESHTQCNRLNAGFMKVRKSENSVKGDIIKALFWQLQSHGCLAQYGGTLCTRLPWLLFTTETCLDSSLYF